MAQFPTGTPGKLVFRPLTRPITFSRVTDCHGSFKFWFVKSGSEILSSLWRDRETGFWHFELRTRFEGKLTPPSSKNLQDMSDWAIANFR